MDPAARPRTSPAQGESGRPGPAGAAAAIAAADPAARIALCQSPLIPAVIVSDLLIRALTIATKLAGYFAGQPFDRDQAHDMARDLARNLTRALDLTRDHDLILALNRTQHHLNLNSEQAHGVIRDLDLVRAINRTRDLDHDLILADALLRDLALASGLSRALNFAGDLARDRAFDLDLDLDLDRDLTRALNLPGDPNVARDLTRDFARNLDLTRALAHHAASRVGQALGIQRVDGLAAALLNGALDDFTDANLADVDLSGVDLTGVRWSQTGTVWPTGMNTETLRARSREVGPGVYMIERRGDSRKAPDHVRT